VRIQHHLTRDLVISLFIFLVLLPAAAPAQMLLGRFSEEDEGAFGRWVKEGKMRPFLEANYGTTKPRYHGLADHFSALGMVELKLGFTRVESVKKAVLSIDERYAFGSYFNPDMEPFGEADEELAQSEIYRLGVGNRLGFGYGWKALSLQLYNQNSLNWTSLEALDPETMDPEALAVFDRYGDQLRFGQLMEAGVRVHVLSSLAVSLGAEGAVIFPRHVFPQWLGSAMLYSMAQGGLQYFGEQIVNLSPVIGPAIHFILKSGVSLGYYLLQKENMNWPFESETPLTLESLKLGATLTF